MRDYIVRWILSNGENYIVRLPEDRVWSIDSNVGTVSLRWRGTAPNGLSELRHVSSVVMAEEGDSWKLLDQPDYSLRWDLSQIRRDYSQEFMMSIMRIMREDGSIDGLRNEIFRIFRYLSRDYSLTYDYTYLREIRISPAESCYINFNLNVNNPGGRLLRSFGIQDTYNFEIG